MTEFRAHLLIFAAMLVAMTVVCIALASIDAGGAAYAVAMMLVGGAAADTSSRVVMHYASKHPHR
jgi:glycine cleavage system pyridoxal-binding protein P